jgi:hypothetical protein
MSDPYCLCPPCQAAITLVERRALGRRNLALGRWFESGESGVFVCTAALRKIAKLGCQRALKSAESAASD